MLGERPAAPVASDMTSAPRPVSSIPLPPSVRIAEGRGGLPCLVVASPLARAEIYFQGAHVAAWHPAGVRDPVLWLSARSHFAPGKPIRGGVPICFPWFGPHPENAAAPAHGFARLREWTLIEALEDEAGTVRLALELAGEGLSPDWPHRFRAVHRIEIGSRLRMALEVRNDGTDPFTFEEALHTYFDVADIRTVSLTGLERGEYLDKLAGGRQSREGNDPIRFTAETDRVYLDTQAACTIDDPDRRRTITVSKSGSDATVVWNPWIAKAHAMPDFGDDEWTGMLCVETGNVNVHARTLAAGATHIMAAMLEVKDRGD